MLTHGGSISTRSRDRQEAGRRGKLAASLPPASRWRYEIGDRKVRTTTRLAGWHIAAIRNMLPAK